MSFSSTPPASAIKTPVNLGLANHDTNPRKIPSLTIKTANGSCVSILNDSEEGDNISPSTDHHKRCLSVPGGCRPFMNSYSQQQSSFRSSSTPGPNTAPAMLPSLTTLVQAVGLVTAEDAEASYSSSSCPVTVQRRRTTGAVRNHPYDHYHHYPVSVPLTAPVVAAAIAPAATKTPSSTAAKTTTGKRKYKCTYQGCGKAFTTSGHLARHQRIHTGEKNFACPFPGCTSRFSRQDNMMQHYRTHLSSKSRRNASPRNVIFVDTSGGASYRKNAGVYNQPAVVAAAPQVYAGSHPIQHHQQLHPFSATNALHHHHHHNHHIPMISPSSASSAGHNSHNHLTSHPASSATGYHSAVSRDSSQQQFPR